MAWLRNEWRGTGRLTADPKVEFVGEGNCLTKFVLAVNESSKTKDRVEFINCQCWNKLAETIGQYCGKGDKIEVAGPLRTDKYENSEGVTKFYTYISVDRMEFVAKNNKTTKKSPPTDQPLPDSARGVADDWSSAKMQDEIFKPDDIDIPF